MLGTYNGCPAEAHILITQNSAKNYGNFSRKKMYRNHKHLRFEDEKLCRVNVIKHFWKCIEIQYVGNN